MIQKLELLLGSDSSIEARVKLCTEILMFRIDFSHRNSQLRYCRRVQYMYLCPDDVESKPPQCSLAIGSNGEVKVVYTR